MDINKLNVFAMLGDRMRWLNQRQRVLAENVANANTPGYEARDLTPPDFGSYLGEHARSIGMAGTKPGHMSGTGGRLGHSKESKAGDVTPTGNTVMLETEMMKVSETATDYELMSNLYGKNLNLIRTAIGRGDKG